MQLTFVGVDDWSRKLYKTETGLILVDVDGVLHTMTPDWGEPCDPTNLRTPVKWVHGAMNFDENGKIVRHKPEGWDVENLLSPS